MPPPLFLQAVQEFNRGAFFAAHELWEELWNEVVGEEKRFYQALVQIAAGYHKFSIGQYNGARKLLERGRQTLCAFPEHYAEVDLAPLIEATATALQSLATGQPLTHPPVIRLLSSPR
ncbi:MAG: DUF309 domain-containing protein [Thermodesulfobacteriota bacterium]|jgi:predicted metal-dependent hydrolase